MLRQFWDRVRTPDPHGAQSCTARRTRPDRCVLDRDAVLDRNIERVTRREVGSWIGLVLDGVAGRDDVRHEC